MMNNELIKDNELNNQYSDYYTDSEGYKRDNDGNYYSDKGILLDKFKRYESDEIVYDYRDRELDEFMHYTDSDGYKRDNGGNYYSNKGILLDEFKRYELDGKIYDYQDRELDEFMHYTDSEGYKRDNDGNYYSDKGILLDESKRYELDGKIYDSKDNEVDIANEKKGAYVATNGGDGYYGGVSNPTSTNSIPIDNTPQTITCDYNYVLGVTAGLSDLIGNITLNDIGNLNIESNGLKTIHKINETFRDYASQSIDLYHDIDNFGGTINKIAESYFNLDQALSAVISSDAVMKSIDFSNYMTFFSKPIDVPQFDFKDTKVSIGDLKLIIDENSSLMTAINGDIADMINLSNHLGDFAEQSNNDLSGEVWDVVRQKCNQFSELCKTKNEYANNFIDSINDSCGQILKFLQSYNYDSLDTSEIPALNELYSATVTALTEIVNQYNSTPDTWTEVVASFDSVTGETVYTTIVHDNSAIKEALLKQIEILNNIKEKIETKLEALGLLPNVDQNAADNIYSYFGKQITPKDSIPAGTSLSVKNFDKFSLLNKDMCIRYNNVTAADLDNLFSTWAHERGYTTSPLVGCGQFFIDAAKENGLDPMALVAISGKETGYGVVGKNYMANHNFFGMDYTYDRNGREVYYGAKNSMYKSDEESIHACAYRIKQFYYNEHGFTTPLKLGKGGYAEGGGAAYGESLAEIMYNAMHTIEDNRNSTTKTQI